jgi:hypothetical protein
METTIPGDLRMNSIDSLVKILADPLSLITLIAGIASALLFLWADEKTRVRNRVIAALTLLIVAGLWFLGRFGPLDPKEQPPTFADALRAIRAHLETPGVRGQRVRYLTLTHLQPSDAEIVRQAILARWPSIVPVGTARCVLVVDLEATGWEKDGTWRQLTTNYPYGIESDDADAKIIVQRTGDDLAILRADRVVPKVLPARAVTLPVAATELGISTEQLRERFRGIAAADRLLVEGEIPRTEWEDSTSGISLYQLLARQLGLGTPITRGVFVAD